MSVPCLDRVMGQPSSEGVGAQGRDHQKEQHRLLHSDPRGGRVIRMRVGRIKFACRPDVHT